MTEGLVVLAGYLILAALVITLCLLVWRRDPPDGGR